MSRNTPRSTCSFDFDVLNCIFFTYQNAKNVVLVIETISNNFVSVILYRKTI